jgi:hypothetical protein
MTFFQHVAEVYNGLENRQEPPIVDPLFSLRRAEFPGESEGLLDALHSPEDRSHS